MRGLFLASLSSAGCPDISLTRARTNQVLATRRSYQNMISILQDTSVVEKRRALQAKKQRLLKGLETLMRMAPDVVATRPGGGIVDDWTDGSHGLLQQGSRRYFLGVMLKKVLCLRFSLAALKIGHVGGREVGCVEAGLCRVRRHGRAGKHECVGRYCTGASLYVPAVCGFVGLGLVLCTAFKLPHESRHLWFEVAKACPRNLTIASLRGVNLVCHDMFAPEFLV